jgi:fatty-acyl-CoA synthase
LSQAEIEYILDHAGTRILCFQAEYLALVDSMRGRLHGIRNYVIMEPDSIPEWAQEYERLLDAASPQAEVDLDAIDENAVVELFYTSGTTGSPKGVTITNRSIYIHTLMAIPGFNVTDEDTLLHVVPLFHVNGWGTPHFLTAVGGKHVILREVDFGEMLRLIEAEQVTRILGVPTIFNGFVNHPDVDKYDLSSLKECIIGGAPSPPSLIDALEDKIGCRAIVGYGLTETTPLLTMARPKSHLKLDEVHRRAIQVKTGIPVVGVRLRVVDRKGQDVAADGKSMGEIIVRGNTVMDGYLHDLDATESVIVNGWFHTGDVAVMDEEGYITIVDRMKDIIISGGENISSVEVEKVILGHPSVFEAVVIGVPDEHWGELPHALVVLKDGEQTSEDELKVFIRAQLAGFKVPKTIEFRAILPKGGTGKIQKRELREPYWSAFDKRIN